nr:hypothetical protein [Methylosinus sp. LW4]
MPLGIGGPSPGGEPARPIDVSGTHVSNMSVTSKSASVNAISTSGLLSLAVGGIAFIASKAAGESGVVERLVAGGFDDLALDHTAVGADGESQDPGALTPLRRTCRG